MKFYTNFEKPARKQDTFTNKKQKVYKDYIDKKTGERSLIVEKEIDVYAKIQEYKDETDISKMISKYNLNMKTQLAEHEAKIIDITNLPENLMETMQLIDNAKSVWEAQSKLVKQKFNNDFNKFIASSENGQLATMLNKELQTAREKFTQEVQAQMPTQQIQQQVQQQEQTNMGVNLNV